MQEVYMYMAMKKLVNEAQKLGCRDEGIRDRMRR
jgi:hypothetical protein